MLFAGPRRGSSSRRMGDMLVQRLGDSFERRIARIVYFRVEASAALELRQRIERGGQGGWKRGLRGALFQLKGAVKRLLFFEIYIFFFGKPEAQVGFR